MKTTTPKKKADNIIVVSFCPWKMTTGHRVLRENTHKDKRRGHKVNERVLLRKGCNE